MTGWKLEKLPPSSDVLPHDNECLLTMVLSAWVALEKSVEKIMQELQELAQERQLAGLGADGSAGVEMRDIDGTRAKIVKLRDDLKQADVTHSTEHVEAAWASLRTVQQDVFKLQSMAGIEIKVIPDQWDLDNTTEEAAAVEPQEQKGS